MMMPILGSSFMEATPINTKKPHFSSNSMIEKNNSVSQSNISDPVFTNYSLVEIMSVEIPKTLMVN